MTLYRFWFRFHNPPQFSPLGLGCGITAFNRADANMILRDEVFKEYGELIIDTVVEKVDIRTLDQLHVVPNMGQILIRGVWWPIGR
jgi:hypothetical protein